MQIKLLIKTQVSNLPIHSKKTLAAQKVSSSVLSKLQLRQDSVKAENS